MDSFLLASAAFPTELLPDTIVGLNDGGSHYYSGDHGWLTLDDFKDRFGVTPYAYFYNNNPHLRFVGTCHVPSSLVPDPYPGRMTFLGWVPNRESSESPGPFPGPILRLALFRNYGYEGPWLNATVGSPQWYLDRSGSFVLPDTAPALALRPDVLPPYPGKCIAHARCVVDTGASSLACSLENEIAVMYGNGPF